VTRTVTRCPARSPPDGVTVTVGWVHEKPGTADLEQAPGFVPAAVLAVAALAAVVVFALVPAAGTDDRPPHEATSRDRMTAAKTALRQSM